MSLVSSVQGEPRLEPRSRRLRRAAETWAPLALLALCLLGCLACLAWFCLLLSDNRKIAALGSGHDIDVGSLASPAVIFARAKYLLDHDEFERAQPLIENIVGAGRADIAVSILYDAANSRMHHAIQLIEDNKFDAAAADVVLARDYYTRALRIDPQFWDAKYNLDIAMRLVREFPDIDVPSDDRKKPTSNLWTDLPGLPKGGP